jgi:hypothetical protein
MIGTMLHIIMLFALLSGVVVVLGLIVWAVVRSGKK